jgi:S1-C subfamily serine protease
MRNLEEATERICELKGDLVALDALIGALLTALPDAVRGRLAQHFASIAEAARTAMLNASISELSIAAFERHVARTRALVDALDAQRRERAERAGVEPLLLATPRVSTFAGARSLTGASGFFFARDERLFLVTSRHVVFDEESGHRPDRIEIELHGDDGRLAQTAAVSLLLYRDGRAVWRQAEDVGGEVDVAVLEIDRAVLGDVSPRAFTPAHLQGTLGEVDVGTPLLIVGFPLGFHDGLHRLPVARQASIASSFGTRFQGQGFFLTDARMHRGSSGAPVVMRDPAAIGDGLPWKLLGIHSARFDMGGRDRSEDESLGLNCAWYADVLMTLTAGDQALTAASDRLR